MHFFLNNNCCWFTDYICVGLRSFKVSYEKPSVSSQAQMIRIICINFIRLITHKIDYTLLEVVQNIKTLNSLIEFHYSMIFLIVLQNTYIKFKEFFCKMIYFMDLEIIVTKDLPQIPFTVIYQVCVLL